MLATTDRITESEACSELWMHLKDIGDDDPMVDRSGIWGVICARTSLEPIEAMIRLRDSLENDPESFKAIYRILPVEAIVKTDLAEISKLVDDLSSIIPEDECFRITVEKRRTDLHSIEIIEAVAPSIDRPVDLEEPDWIVLIEVLGRITGISVVNPDGILNIQKEKFELSKSSQ
ncbi:MAG: THUMP domain-containing protein [Candidatus Bathyarchaeia archaeon]